MLMLQNTECGSGQMDVKAKIKTARKRAFFRSCFCSQLFSQVARLLLLRTVDVSLVLSRSKHFPLKVISSSGLCYNFLKSHIYCSIYNHLLIPSQVSFFNFKSKVWQPHINVPEQVSVTSADTRRGGPFALSLMPFDDYLVVLHPRSSLNLVSQVGLLCGIVTNTQDDSEHVALAVWCPAVGRQSVPL